MVGSLAGLGTYLATGGRRPRGRWLAGGVGSFALIEYLNHRFLLHGKPASQPFIRSLQRRLHYDHHRRPNDLDLLFLPWWFGVPNMVLYGYCYYRATGNPETAVSILAGNMVALLYYEYVHYLAHIPVTPSTPWGRYMKKYHLLHHYKNEHYWFGVTSPTMDHAFATYRNVEAVEKSGTTHALEGDYVEPDRH
jgi:hypothetical protein